MDFQEWEPIYIRILADFGYSRDADERSMRLLASLAPSLDLCDDGSLRDVITEEVTVIGGGISSDSDMDAEQLRGAVISCGSGTGKLLGIGRKPDVLVTDLDGDVRTDIAANHKGCIAVIHAHGDNMSAIRTYAPMFRGRVVLTGQSRPFMAVKNYGGFTDGDRAVLLAVSLGARKIRLVGFDFENPMAKDGTDPAVKSKKLGWAKWILENTLPKSVEVSYGPSIRRSAE